MTSATVFRNVDAFFTTEADRYNSFWYGIIDRVGKSNFDLFIRYFPGLLLVQMASLVDMCTTFIALNIPATHEANPLLAPIVNNLGALFILKTLFISALAIYLAQKEQHGDLKPKEVQPYFIQLALLFVLVGGLWNLHVIMVRLGMIGGGIM